MKNYKNTALEKLALEQDNKIKWFYYGSLLNENDFNNINVQDGKSFNFDWNDVQAKANELEQDDIQAKQAKEIAKASALAKLSALGLTEEEVQAIIK